jgi:hypothetical protein
MYFAQKGGVVPHSVATVDVLQQYASAVIERADHHARTVDAICLAILGAIVWRKDGDVEVLVRNGDMKNALWFSVNGRRYAVSYNHANRCIDVRDGTNRGTTLRSFTNADSVSAVMQFFGSL